ncbi:decapping endonuclease targeting mRNA [Penicillium waksmanii]|uniref:decapping endonuclease targeting mRNA n=1 Tax=Penicillium waksmanii TaxID=69791 RepID=UPI0025498CB5|nr:decapping endonuclease targeting mRNA [Penicillium waksmanii]KAJ5966065.1 decapping endonuclease targeting mRNA [Penicillium waksmanii]
MSQATFNIQPVNRFGGQGTTIRRPREVTCFSYDRDRQFMLGDSSLAYYYPPSLPADLNIGFETFQKLNDAADEHLDALLDTIVALERDTEKKCETDIITWRGMMTKMGMLCNLREPFFTHIVHFISSFEMNATCFQGTMYDILPLPGFLSYFADKRRFIEENNSYKNEQKEKQKAQRMPPGMASQERMMYWGYKFEVLSVLHKPWDPTTRAEIEGRQDEVVNNSAQYCSVVKTGMGNVRMILGGEVDAVWDCKPERKEDPIHWVELKTSAEIRNDRDMLKYERKLLKFWAQSFLLGVPTIIVGFRDQDGIVRRLEELDTASIPGKVKKLGRGSWDGNICINFAAQFLEWLKHTIQQDGTWRIRKQEKSSVIEVFKVEESGHGDILSPAFRDWRSQAQA